MAKRVKIYNQTHRVSKQLNKHGRLPIKKMDKKEREEARANCLHHAEKNGRVKSRTLDNMDNTCTCRICSARFGVNGATKDEYKKMTKPIVEQIDLLKWVCQSAGIVDQKTVDYYCKMQYMLLRFPNTEAVHESEKGCQEEEKSRLYIKVRIPVRTVGRKINITGEEVSI